MRPILCLLLTLAFLASSVANDWLGETQATRHRIASDPASVRTTMKQPVVAGKVSSVAAPRVDVTPVRPPRQMSVRERIPPVAIGRPVLLTRDVEPHGVRNGQFSLIPTQWDAKVILIPTEWDVRFDLVGQSRRSPTTDSR